MIYLTLSNFYHADARMEIVITEFGGNEYVIRSIIFTIYLQNMTTMDMLEVKGMDVF